MRKWGLCLLMMVLSVSVCHAQEDATRLQLKTASSHPMQYYLSLPQGWTSGKKWPVVIVIESANRAFQENAELFVQARRKMPFILVAPLVVTNGGPRYRSVPTYHYSDATWDQIAHVGEYRFDMEGMAAIIAEIKKLYGGEDRVFITGWEAGGHTVCAMLFQHPEALRGVALVCPNYAGRGMSEANFSSSPTRVQLPVKCFAGAKDPAWAPDKPLYVQWETAKKVAQAHGYRNLSQALVAGKDHESLAPEVLNFFFSLLNH